VIRVERQRVDAALIDRFVELSRREYHGGPTTDPLHLRWKYLQNPAGVAIADCVWQGPERLIGRVLYQPRLLHYGNSTFRAALVVDLLVDREFRDKGAFVPLAAKMGRLEEINGFDLQLIAPNDTSRPVYEKLLRLSPLQHLDLYALPVAPHRVLTGASPILARSTRVFAVPWRGSLRRGARRHDASREYSLGTEYPGDSAIDSLHRAVRSGGTVVGDRSASFHRWRFDEHGFPYDVRYVSARRTIVGYVACRLVEIEGLRALLIVDLVGDPAYGEEATRILVWHAINDAIEREADLVVALSTGDASVTRHLRSAPLLRVPRRFAPQSMPVFTRTLGRSDKGDFASATFALTLADLDVF
jgi:hypothetical protein